MGRIRDDSTANTAPEGDHPYLLHPQILKERLGVLLVELARMLLREGAVDAAEAVCAARARPPRGHVPGATVPPGLAAAPPTPVPAGPPAARPVSAAEPKGS